MPGLRPGAFRILPWRWLAGHAGRTLRVVATRNGGLAFDIPRLGGDLAPAFRTDSAR